jgi:hypothetical protein
VVTVVVTPGRLDAIRGTAGGKFDHPDRLPRLACERRRQEEEFALLGLGQFAGEINQFPFTELSCLNRARSHPTFRELKINLLTARDLLAPLEKIKIPGTLRLARFAQGGRIGVEARVGLA